MKRIPHPICPWCRRELASKRPVRGTLICEECHSMLLGLPAEKLARMVVYFAGYSQFALQLLLESNDLIKGFTAEADGRHAELKPQKRKPQTAMAIAPVPPGKRSIA